MVVTRLLQGGINLGCRVFHMAEFADRKSWDLSLSICGRSAIANGPALLHLVTPCY